MRFIDLHHWREWRLDLARWSLALAPSGLEDLRARAAEGLMLCRARRDQTPEALRAVEHAEAFLASLGDALPAGPEDLVDLPLPLGPLAAVWARISDVPLESFFEEDYRTGGPAAEGFARLPVIGALSLPVCDDLDVPLPEPGPDNFSLITPGVDCVAEYPLPLDELPPILDEFCGARGNSNQGKMINLGLDARLVSELPVATPLCRLEPGGGFATLYLHFKTPQDNTVSLPLRPSQARRVGQSLPEQGFTRVRAVGPNQIWRRGEDWVHCVWAAPGLESEDVMQLPPFVIAAQAEGSQEPAPREALLASIVQTALGHVPQSRA